MRPFVGVERCYDIEVLACKIAQHKHEHIVLDFKENARNLATSGIETAVKNICDTLVIPYGQIEFRSCDRLTNGNIFKHKINDHMLWFFPQMALDSVEITIPNSYNYGLFCGRPTNERLYSFHKHVTWDNRARGLASQHLNLEIEDESNSDYTQFICEHHDKWQTIRPLIPCSDVDSGYVYKEMKGASKGQQWRNMYNKLAVEIIIETIQTPDVFFLTEKTYRPINYGRLFFVVGSENFESNLKKLGFDIFDDLLDKSYDHLSSYMRIDKIFKSLDQLLKNPIDYNKILHRLEKNKLLLQDMAKHDPILMRPYIE